MTRHRERDLRQQYCGNQYTKVPLSNLTICMDHGHQDFCDDVVGNPNGVNPFVKRDVDTNYPVLDGQQLHTDGSILRSFTGCPIGYRPIPADPTAHWGLLSAADLNEYAWRILAETNPSVPHVSVPTFIGELKDLPGLIRGWGGGLLKTAARANLSWRWALRPLISDLRKLWNFQQAVDKRLTDLLRLREGKTLRRRCHLGKSEFKGPMVTNHLFHSSNGATVRGHLQTTYTEEVWGTAHWSIGPGSVLPELGGAALDNLAKRLTFGFTSAEAVATAWELTPWSWLASWFSNIDDVIAASNNSIGLHWSKVCVMRHMYTRVHARPDPAQTTPWVKVMNDYYLVHERKERFPCFPVVPVPLPSLPILTGGQLSILASLAALRR